MGLTDCVQKVIILNENRFFRRRDSKVSFELFIIELA